jgi:hypothetical protein
LDRDIQKINQKRLQRHKTIMQDRSYHWHSSLFLVKRQSVCLCPNRNLHTCKKFTPHKLAKTLSRCNCGVQLRGARVVWRENFARFCYMLLLRGLIGWGISLRNCAPQLHPAIAPRKSRLERKLQGARVASTQHVITLINSHVVIHEITT